MRKILFLTAVLLLGLTTCSDSDVPITGVSLNYSSAALSVGETKRKVATVLPSNATNRNVSWSTSNPNVATVSNGTVTAVAQGTATITATTECGNRTATSTITVSTPTVSVTGVSLNKNEATLPINETITLVATVTPANATNQTVTWSSSNSDVATVDNSGLVRAVTAGTATIIASTTDGGHIATATITVDAATIVIAVTDVTLDISEITLIVGASEMLTATIIPENATNTNHTWTSSNPTIVSVDANGIITAVSAGTATITVTTEDGSHTATTTIIVPELEIPVANVVLDWTELTLSIGDTETLFAIITPNNATNQNVTWRSGNPNVATVDENGVITAVSVGQTDIIVTTECGARIATCVVTVNPPRVTGITLNMSEITLYVGGFTFLSATTFPIYTFQDVIWSSSNTSVVTIDANGRVSAVSVGTAIITGTAHDGLHYDTCVVTVKPIPATGVTVITPKISLYVGEMETLTAHVFPDNATNRNVTWSSDNQSVATVDNNGQVTAISVGTANITVTTEDGGHTSTATVTVTTPIIPVTSVTLNRTEITLYTGESERLTALVFPENATRRYVMWHSSNPAIIAVDNYGLVTTRGAGTAVITALIPYGAPYNPYDARATATVTVNPPITDVILNRTEFWLTVGETETLTATVFPENAPNRNVTWASSNQSVATVDANGQVAALSAGTATITVTTESGAVTATSVVTVRDVITISSSLDGVVIDGIRWATRNVATPGTFADNPEDSGMLFRWGTLGASGAVEYTDNSTLIVPDWVNNSTNRVAWTAENDPCPAGWRVPTREELEQLRSAIGWLNGGWITHNGVNGAYFGTAPNQIFLPAAGLRTPIGRIHEVGIVGVYWSSTPDGLDPRWYWSARTLFIGGAQMSTSNRASGNSIRCVAE